MVYPGFMKNKTNECHNKCYTGCDGDDISDQKGGRFYPEKSISWMHVVQLYEEEVEGNRYVK